MLIFYDVMFQIYGFQLFHSPYYYDYNKLYIISENNSGPNPLLDRIRPTDTIIALWLF